MSAEQLAGGKKGGQAVAKTWEMLEVGPARASTGNDTPVSPRRHASVIVWYAQLAENTESRAGRKATTSRRADDRGDV